jgi:hypothetical protein
LRSSRRGPRERSVGGPFWVGVCAGARHRYDRD